MQKPQHENFNEKLQSQISITDVENITNHSNRSEIFLAVGLFVLLIAVLAAIRRRLLICEIEDMWKAALYRRDAAGVGAVNDVPDFLRELQAPLFNDLTVFDDVDGNVAVDEGQDVQIQRVDVTLHLQDVLLAHLTAPGVFDDRNRAVQLVQPKIMINFHGSAGTNVIQHEALFNLTNAKYMCYVCHNILSRAPAGAHPNLSHTPAEPQQALRKNFSAPYKALRQNLFQRSSRKPSRRSSENRSHPALNSKRLTPNKTQATARLNRSPPPKRPYTSMFSRFRIAAMRT